MSEQFRPRLTGNPIIDEAFRQAFDYIYQLHGQTTTIQSTVANVQRGLTGLTGVGGVGGATGTGGGSVLSGPFESRPPTAAVGTVWVELSRSGISATSGPLPTFLFSESGWVYVGGMFYRTQPQLATLAATLGAADAGATVYVGAPYAHHLLWTGGGWGWVDPGDASGRFAHFAADPGSGWQLVDGSTVNALNSDGTITAVTLPDSTGAKALFLKSGAYTGSRVAEVAPTTVAVSAGTPAGTLAMNAQNMSNATATLAPGVTTVLTGPTSFTVTGTFNGSAMGTHAHTVSLAGGDPVAELAAPLYYRI